MGIITKIEDKLGDVVENPFREKDALDLLAIEICLKRLIEVKRKNILGKILIPNIITIIINKKKFEEYELFLDDFKKTLEKSLDDWMKEKGYELPRRVELIFKGGQLEGKTFEVYVSYENRWKADQLQFVVGELINKGTEESFRINQNFIILGRGEDCLIRINDPTVSRKHASLSYQYGKVILEDLKSKCGTWVNHQRICRHILSHGDNIVIGRAEFVFLDLGNPEKPEFDLPSDGGTKETTLRTGATREKMTSSNPDLWGLSYFF